jgi:hypothetical protein
MVMPVYGDDGMGPVVSSFSQPEDRDWIDGEGMVIQTRTFDTFNIYRNDILVAENSNNYYYLDEEVDEGQEYCYTVVLLDDEGNELVTSIEQCATVGGGPSQLSVEYNSGWNMVGLPLLIEDTNYQSLFPNAQNGTLYSFVGIYQSETNLQAGVGYLLRMTESGPVSFTGLLIEEVTISLQSGWNIFSGLSTALTPDYLYSFDIIQNGTIYGLDGIYYSPGSIEPGNGYWIRANEAGEISLTSNGALTKERVFTNHLEGSNTLDISNGEHTTTLYFGKKVPEEELLSYSLPPVFEGLEFDARFTGDMKYVFESGEIEIVNTTETMTLSYDITIEAGEHMNWVLTSVSGKDYILEGAGEITVPSSETFILNRESVIPVTFALHQNFPNPFNPITTLRYDLPSDAMVTLTVFDMLGKEITQLVNTTQQAGFKSVQWDATDSMGRPVGAGVYLYQIQAGDPSLNSGQGFVQTKKMVLLK